jgi:DNA invertase Pin-like site-specific DNA recombinase
VLNSRNIILGPGFIEPMKLGYARVPLVKIGTVMQLLEPLPGVDKVFVDKVSKSPQNRLRFREMLEAARIGDCIVVLGLDHLANSSLELRLVLTNLERRQLKLTSLTDRLEAISPANIFPAFQAITNFKSQLSDNPGLAAARERGLVGGRKPVLTREKKEILDQLLKQSHDLRAHAHVIGVSVRTVRRYATGEYTKHTPAKPYSLEIVSRLLGKKTTQKKQANKKGVTSSLARAAEQRDMIHRRFFLDPHNAIQVNHTYKSAPRFEANQSQFPNDPNSL